MKIVLDQPIAATARQAQAAFLDPEFYRSLGGLEGISAPEVRSISVDAGKARIVIGYRFDGQLNGVARSILDPSKLSWAQETEVDLATKRSQVRMVPDNYQKLLSFEGWYELRDTGGDSCVQHFEADLRVHLPVVGALAERALAGSIRQNIASTATLVEGYVPARKPGGGRR